MLYDFSVKDVKGVHSCTSISTRCRSLHLESLQRQPEDVLPGFWKVGSTVQSNSSGQAGHSSAPKKSSVQSCKLRLEVSSYYTLGYLCISWRATSFTATRAADLISHLKCRGHGRLQLLESEKMLQINWAVTPVTPVTPVTRHTCHRQPQPL